MNRIFKGVTAMLLLSSMLVGGVACGTNGNNEDKEDKETNTEKNSENGIESFAEINPFDMLDDDEKDSIDNYPFYGKYTNQTGEYSAFKGVNAIYENFSGVSGTDSLVYQFGNEANYFEWVSGKIVFTKDSSYKEALKSKILTYPQSDTGYMWSWSSSTYWPTGNGDMHYDGNFRYINAVYDIISWEGDTDFLKKVCNSGGTSGKNATKGKTVYEKCVLAIDYALNKLHGSEGVINITEESMVLADGEKRLDEINGKYIWNNTGKCGSCPSNYWDNYCFGGYDAYETVIFYNALNSMAGIETMLGNTENAKKYEELASLVHEKFDEMFWDEEKGRYISCIDSDGVKRDFGLTFLNTEALAVGLGDSEKAEKILSWIDGERIVEGDTLTGTDIMSYTRFVNQFKSKKYPETEEYILAPVSNTVAIESVNGSKNKSYKRYWWYSLNGAINVGSGENAAYGYHLENGGYIFYTVYYELMARVKYQSADKVLERYEQIAKVYEYNGLNSDLNNWAEGLVGEFPESGLPYAAFVYGLIGADGNADGLCIKQSVPSNCDYIGMKDFCYANKKYDIAVSKGSAVLKALKTGINIKLSYYVEDGYTCKVTLYDENKNVISESTVDVGEDGYAHISVSDENASVVCLYKSVK